MNLENEEFLQLKRKGFIEFVTFHPSYSYGEFVEGIRAVSKGESVHYPVRDGIFKKICKRAAYPNFIIDNWSKRKSINRFSIPKDIRNDYKLNDGDKVGLEIIGYPSEDKLIDNFKLTSGGEVVLHENNFENDKKIEVFIKSKNGVELQNNKPYLLIIDEINRGNMPEIFGELITLLEKDKRKNGENPLTVKLPYSHEEFAVPSNLYIIGTMNTADRSIALLDVALRRRFSFLEFTVDYEVLLTRFGFKDWEEVEERAESKDIRALSILGLKKINSKIRDELKLGKDKQIGHSYILKITGENVEEKAVMVWKYDILPLLEEYFYGRYDKIKEILADEKGIIVDESFKLIRDFDIAQLRDVLYDLIHVKEA